MKKAVISTQPAEPGASDVHQVELKSNVTSKEEVRQEDPKSEPAAEPLAALFSDQTPKS